MPVISRPVPKQSANFQLKYGSPALKLKRPHPIPKRATAKPPGDLYALDTETTGLDILHGCRPFMVQACHSKTYDVLVWEWDVDPLTREPIIPDEDFIELVEFLNSNHFVLHNAKFDTRALEALGLPRINFEHCHDTHLAAHVLMSAESLKLKDLALRLLDFDDDDQKDLREAVNKARMIGRKLGWRIAKQGDPHFPAAKTPKDGWSVMDYWLPRAVAQHCHYSPEHPWWTIAKVYGSLDVERTIALWELFQEGLEEEGLWYQYKTRQRLLRVTYEMESAGVTFSSPKIAAVKPDYEEKQIKAEKKCYSLANKEMDNLNSSQKMQTTLFKHFKLKPGKRTKSGANSVDKDVLASLLHQAQPGSKAEQFITNLIDSRAYDKALDYLDGYSKYGVEVKPAWWFLRPNFNISGTATTRFSSDNPNMQNVSKKEKINLRQVFGPMPGREWWAMDFSNIEMRIFAFCSGDRKLIELFENGQSVHYAFCEALWPKEFAQCLRDGVEFKDRYESTLYQWCKNGNFALIYGAGIKKADTTYHVTGAYDLIRKKLPLIDKFMSAKDSEARRHGYITTLGGYRLQVPEKRPHVAVNYFVQGTAGWMMINAMLRVYEYLQNLDDYRMIMTIHDELDFDFPVAAASKKPLGYAKGKEGKIPLHYGNIPVAYDVKRLMEDNSEFCDFATPVDVERHADNWAVGERIKDWNIAV
jgi:DNA polymerase I-like protein with 3'-5' exonuclease and polymerase domains